MRDVVLAVGLADGHEADGTVEALQVRLGADADRLPGPGLGTAVQAPSASAVEARITAEKVGRIFIFIFSSIVPRAAAIEASARKRQFEVENRPALTFVWCPDARASGQ